MTSTGALSTTGDSSAGIIAMRGFVYDPVDNEGTYDVGGSAVSVTSNGNVTTLGRDSFGIAAAASQGDTSVVSNGNISTVGLEAYGIIAGGQNVTIASDGSISTTGDGAHGILVAGIEMVNGEAEIVGGIAGDATITAGSVATSGDSSNGIHVSADGDVSITSDAVEVTGTATDPGAGPDVLRIAQGGIIVEGGDGAITIDAGSVDVEGEYRYGVSVRGNGAIDVAVDDVTLASADSAGVAARGGAGAVSVITGSITTTGASGAGLVATSTSGAITIDAGTTRVENAGFQGPFTGDAVTAISDTGTVSITNADAYSAALYGSAVVGISGGDVTIASGTAETTGENGVAVYGRSYAGNVDIAAAETVLGGADALGIWAWADSGDATVAIGTLASAGAGLGGGAFVRADNGTATATTTGDVTATYGYALRGQGANVSLTTGVDTITSAGAQAIWALASETVTIVNGGTASTSGDLASAILAQSAGAISITSDTVGVTGAGADPGVGPDGLRIAQGGIIVEGGDGAIAIDVGSVDVEGEYRYGVSVRGNGAIDIAADDVTLASADSVAVVARGGAGDVSLTTGTVTTTGASGVGVFANTTTGAIVIEAGTTRVENAGLAGQFTGDAVVATSGSGAISVTSADAFSAALNGSAVVAISGGDVSVDSGIATTSGDGGVAVLGQSNNGTLTFASDSVTTTGANTRAIRAHAFNGVANVAIGDVTALGANASGVLASGREVNLVVDGTVRSTQIAVNVAAQGGLADVVINGAIVSIDGPGLVSSAQNGVVTVSEGASVSGGTVGVVLIGGLQGGFTQFYNSGTVTGGAGAAVVGLPNANATVPSFYIQNNGTLVAGDSGIAVFTGAGDDVLELTNLSVIDGIADLGAGDDRMVLDLNDDAPAGAVGQVASTLNVEVLSVDGGSWRAEGEQSEYDLIDIEDGATLTVVENAEGSLAVEAGSVELNGVLRLDLSVDETEGDLGETTIFGGGSLHLIGIATVELTDASGLQHTGGTFVENGELLLTTLYGGDITTSGQGVFELAAGGDFTGNLVNDGTFVFSRTDDYSFLGDFSGSGLLEKQGDGTLTFAGLYGFDGTTSVLGGSVAFTGQLSEDTELDLTEGIIDLSQVEGGEQTIAKLSGEGGTLELGETQLVIDQSDNTAFTGEIDGSGTIQKEGEGDLKLEGDGTGFTGTGEVGGGTLSVNGNFENADFVVNEGGTLGGSGTVGDTTVNGGGTLAPGNSIDTLNINGDVTFTAASVYEVEVDAAGNGDRINATGTATLGGASVNVIAASGTYRPLTDYTILTAAGGVSGAFGSVQDNLAFLDPSLIYSANAVTLRLVRNDIDFAAFGTTANQVAIGGLIESFGYGNTLYDETLMLVDDDVAPSFASLTGEVYPAYGAALIETAEVLRRQTADATQHAEGAYAWTTGLYNNVDSGSGAGEIDLKGRGLAGGFGFATGGFSASAGVGILDQEGGGSRFSDGEVTFAIGRLAYTGMPGLSVSAGAQFGWVDGQTRRQTTLGTINQAVTGQIDGDYLQVFGEVAYRLPVGNGLGVEPFVGVSHVSLDLDNVTETGAPTALAVAAIDRAVTFADVGLRLSGEVGSGVRPFASAAYRHAWGDRPSVAAFGFAGTAGTALVGAVPIAKSAGELEAGLVVTRGMIDFEVGVDATISEGFDSHGVNAGFKVRF